MTKEARNTLLSKKGATTDEIDLIESLIERYLQTKAKTKLGVWLRFIVKYLPVRLIISILENKIKNPKNKIKDQPSK